MNFFFEGPKNMFKEFRTEQRAKWNNRRSIEQNVLTIKSVKNIESLFNIAFYLDVLALLKCILSLFQSNKINIVEPVCNLCRADIDIFKLLKTAATH